MLFGLEMMNKPLVILTNLLAGIAPYFTFMEYHDYAYLTPEAAVYFLFFACFGLAVGMLAAYISPRRAVIVTSLMMFFSYDLQFNGSLSSSIIIVFYMVIIIFLLKKLKNNGYKICIAALGAFIFSTLLIGVEDNSSDIQFATPAPNAGKKAGKPIIVHIILDEHIGLEGVPSKVPGGKQFSQDLRVQYETQGFSLYGNAFSEHSYTRYSLAMAMNNVATVSDELKQNKHADQWMSQNYALVKNAYLKEMSKRGYRIYIRQSNYLNLCAAQDVAYARCQTYDFSKLEAIAGTNLPMASKLLLFASFQAQNTRLRKTLVMVLNASQKSWNYISGHKTKPGEPLWSYMILSLERPLIGGLSHANTLELLGADILRASPGDLFLTHLLQPHYPHVYDAQCHIRPASEWIHRGTNPGYSRNDQALRAFIYKGYFAHTRCVNRKIQKFTQRLKKAGMLDKTVIIIHGDHGSRVLVNELYKSEFKNPDAHKEAHSTLFAVRLPGEKAVYRQHAANIRTLLWELIGNGFSQAPADIERGQQTVLVLDEELQIYTRIKYLGATSKGE